MREIWAVEARLGRVDYSGREWGILSCKGSEGLLLLPLELRHCLLRFNGVSERKYNAQFQNTDARLWLPGPDDKAAKYWYERAPGGMLEKYSYAQVLALFQAATTAKRACHQAGKAWLGETTDVEI